MILLDHEEIIEGLLQFANQEEQRRLWMGKGQERWTEFSTFDQAYCELFEDSALEVILYSRRTAFDKDVDTMLRKLDGLIKSIDTDQDVEDIIADPKMTIVRAVASIALERIMSMGRKNGQRILDRVVEWRDEERQRMLWLPRAGEPPISSPRCAEWHLFHGRDYWRYLDLGVDEREFSTLFWDLRLLVIDLRTFNRPPEEVLTDSKMDPIREMAARIACKLGIATRMT